MSIAKKLPATVVAHSGAILNPNMQFPVLPPPEIGEVRTAQSTVGVKRDFSIPVRILISVGVMLLVAVVIVGILQVTWENRQANDLPKMIGCGLVFGLVVGIIAFFVTGARHRVTFVGDLGVVRHKFKQVDAGPTKTQLLLFSQTNDLRTSQVSNYQNGIYTGTTYQYIWYDDAGTKLFQDSGTYRGNRDGLPKKDSDPFFFALSAERAYNGFATDRLVNEFEANGVVEFYIGNHKRRDSVRVGDGFLEFNFKGKVDRVEADDIKKLSVDQGTFYIDTKDAKFFGFKGKFRFDYSQMSNAQLFLHALEQLAGFTVQ